MTVGGQLSSEHFQNFGKASFLRALTIRKPRVEEHLHLIAFGSCNRDRSTQRYTSLDQAQLRPPKTNTEFPFSDGQYHAYLSEFENGRRRNRVYWHMYYDPLHHMWDYGFVPHQHYDYHPYYWRY